MTTDASNHDRTTKAFERLEHPLGQFTEPTIVVTEPTVAALPYRSAAAMAMTSEPTAIVTETTMAALAAMSASSEDPEAKTVPFEPVTGVALPTAPPSAEELAAVRAREPRVVVARGTGDRSSAAHRAVERAANERAANERAANERTAVDPDAIERIAAERAAVERAAAERAAAERAAVERAAPVERSAAVERSAKAHRPVEPVRAATEGDVKIGKYSLLRHLASGGTSHVFLARIEGPTGFSRHLVVKTLRREHAGDPAHVAAFVDEAWFLSTLHHGNIVQIFDVGASEDGTHYLAMDYLHGETLRAVIQQARANDATLPLGFAITAVASCAEALHYVHTRHGSDGRWLRMVHRDVTPSNLMVCYDGSVKLIDFGSAKSATRASHTPAGAVKGEAAYMAPEQARGDAVDLRSDVFSLGVVLYELTTRIHPFADRSVKATKQRLLQGDITPPSQLLADYPAELSRVVMTALARDPAMRYRDCGALGQALLELAGRLELRTGPSVVRNALTELFGAKPEAWVSENAAPQPSEARKSEPHPATSRKSEPRAAEARKSEPRAAEGRRDKPTRPLQPDRSAPLAVPQAATAHPSGGVMAAKAAALPPSVPVVTPSARVAPPPPPRLPAASSFAPEPQRPGRAPRSEPLPLPSAPAIGTPTLPSAPPPPPAMVAMAMEAARAPAPPPPPAQRQAPHGASSYSLVSPQEVQHLVEHAWGGVRPAMAADQWANAIAEARNQHRPVARGTTPTPTAEVLDPHAVELTTGAASSQSIERPPARASRGARVALELTAMAAAVALVVSGPVLGQLALDQVDAPAADVASVVPAAPPHGAAPAPKAWAPSAAPATVEPAPAAVEPVPAAVEPRAAVAAEPSSPADADAPTAKAGAPTAKADAPTAKAGAPTAKADAPTAKAGAPTAKAGAPTAKADAPTVTLTITSEPAGALVTLDGKRLGRTPLRLQQPAQAGAGALRVRLEGYRVHRADLERDADANLAIRLRPAPAAPADAAGEPVPDFMRARQP